MGSQYKGPLRAFRIARAKFPLFDGTGAAIGGARWNTKGQRVIYAAESYATALLEILVHSNLGRVPRGFALIEIHIPSEIDIEEITPSDLPKWDTPDCLVSQSFGSRWYREMRTAVLIVPSVAASGRQRNILINQDHPRFHQLSASAPHPIKWDPSSLPPSGSKMIVPYGDKAEVQSLPLLSTPLNPHTHRDSKRNLQRVGNKIDLAHAIAIREALKNALKASETAALSRSEERQKMYGMEISEIKDSPGLNVDIAFNGWSFSRDRFSGQSSTRPLGGRHVFARFWEANFPSWPSDFWRLERLSAPY